MAVTGYGGKRTLFDEDQECYRTSSGNRELRFGRGCVQTSAAVDGGRSFPPTPLSSGPSDGERRSRRWSAHQWSSSPSSLHRYHHLQPPSPPFSSQSSEHHQIQNQKFKHSPTHTEIQTQSHHTKSSYPDLNHRFSHQFKTHNQSHQNQFHDHQNSINSTCETQSTKTHSRFSHHNLVTKYSPKPIDDYPIKDPREYNLTPKSKPSLPKNQYTSLQDMMQFVTEWFDFEESEKASCDWSENKVVDCENRFHENFVNDHCDGKLEKENFDVESEFDASDLNIDAWEISNVLPGGSLVLSKNTGFKNFNKAHKWSTSQYVSMGHACSEYVFSDFVNENNENDVKLEEVKIDIDCMSTNLEKQGIIDFVEQFENSLSCEEIVQRNIMYDKGLVSEVDLVAKRNIPFGCVGKKNLQSELFVLVTEFNKGDTTIVKEKFKVEALFSIGLVNVLPPTCVQNLSGVELNLDQWEQIIPFTRSNNFLLFFNHVSKNFVNGSWDVEATNLRDMDLYGVWVVKLKALDDYLMSKRRQFLSGSTTRSSYAEPKNRGQDPCQFYMELVFIWKVFLLDMLTSNELKREFSIGVYHNHKKMLALVGRMVSTLGFGFENVKTKGVRRRQWQIAWAFSAFRWTIVLVPFWIWDELRREFSVVVYHSHKANRRLLFDDFSGLHSSFPLVVLLATRRSIPACFNRTRGRVLFEERATDVGDILYW